MGHPSSWFHVCVVEIWTGRGMGIKVVKLWAHPQPIVIPSGAKRSRGICSCSFRSTFSHALHHTRISSYLHKIALMDERLYSTYIVASQSRILYIGVTGNLSKRVFEHKWKEHDGFSCRYNCDRLVWFERYQNVSLAIAREKQLKRWNRAKKIALIEHMNPTWADLSRNWYEYEPRDCTRVTGQSPW